MTPRALVVMAKRPIPGQAKSRLVPPLTPEQAAALYEAFLLDVLEVVRRVPAVTPAIAITPPQAEPYFAAIAPDFQLRAQQGATLGARLDHVLSGCLADGFAMACALASDVPTLPAEYLEAAFEQLARPEVDIVLAPSPDGGYYLIGCKRPQPRLLREVPMSTSRVLAQTLALARQEAQRAELLSPWPDVDDVDDLERLHRSLIGLMPQRARHTRWLLAQLSVPGRHEQTIG